MRRLVCLSLFIAAICGSTLVGFAQSKLGGKTPPPKAPPAKADEKANLKEKGGRYALLVGVEQYVHPKLSPLQYSVDDVTSLSDVLKGAGYEVTLLTDDTGKKDKSLAPTKLNFDSKFLKILNQCKTADDKIIVAFAGHGLQFEGKKDAYFCPTDAKPFTEETASLISIRKLYADLDHSYAGVKIVLMDACRNDPDPGRGRGVEADLIPPPKGIAALFSCSSGERAFESDALKHGVFFHHVLEGLSGKAAGANGDITFYGLTDYVCTAVPTTMTSLFPGKKQQPNFKADIAGTPPVLARVEQPADSGPLMVGSPTLTSLANTDDSATEKFVEDFRGATNFGLPDGWVMLNGRLGVRQDAGRPHLRTCDNQSWDNNGLFQPWHGQTSSTRLPPISIKRDFYVEMSVLNNQVWKDGKRSFSLTLRGGKDEKLICRTFEGETGFVTVLPNSEESKPFALAGNSPYRYRMERKNGTYLVTNNGKTLLSHDANDHREFDVVELEISPTMMVGNIKVGPWTADKPVVEKSEPKKPMKSGNRK